MPRRSNQFQKLIHLLHHQLAGAAKVTESTLLQEYTTGEEREVDIVVETLAGSYSIVIGIECTSCKRRADVTWIEGMWAKHQKLPTNKLILVSKSGFTKPAIREAELKGIEVLSISKAQSTDWTSIVKNEKDLFFIRVDTSPRSCELVLLSGDGGETRTKLANPDDMLFNDVGEAQATMRQIILSLLGEPTTKKMIFENMPRIEDSHLIASYQVPKGWYVVDRDGNKHLVKELHYHCECKRREKTPIKLSGGTFGGIPVCYGQLCGSSWKGVFAASQEKGKPPKYSIEFYKNDGGSGQVMDLFPF